MGLSGTWLGCFGTTGILGAEEVYIGMEIKTKKEAKSKEGVFRVFTFPNAPAVAVANYITE